MKIKSNDITLKRNKTIQYVHFSHLILIFDFKKTVLFKSFMKKFWNRQNISYHLSSGLNALLLIITINQYKDYLMQKNMCKSIHGDDNYSKRLLDSFECQRIEKKWTTTKKFQHQFIPIQNRKLGVFAFLLRIFRALKLREHFLRYLTEFGQQGRRSFYFH